MTYCELTHLFFVDTARYVPTLPETRPRKVWARLVVLTISSPSGLTALSQSRGQQPNRWFHIIHEIISFLAAGELFPLLNVIYGFFFIVVMALIGIYMTTLTAFPNQGWVCRVVLASILYWRKTGLYLLYFGVVSLSWRVSDVPISLQLK